MLFSSLYPLRSSLDLSLSLSFLTCPYMFCRPPMCLIIPETMMTSLDPSHCLCTCPVFEPIPVPSPNLFHHPWTPPITPGPPLSSLDPSHFRTHPLVCPPPACWAVTRPCMDRACCPVLPTVGRVAESSPQALRSFFCNGFSSSSSSSYSPPPRGGGHHLTLPHHHGAGAKRHAFAYASQRVVPGGVFLSLHSCTPVGVSSSAMVSMAKIS